MPPRKRSVRPLEIALTEEQIEAIIAEAACRTRGPSASPRSPARGTASWGASAVSEAPGAFGTPGIIFTGTPAAPVAGASLSAPGTAIPASTDPGSSGPGSAVEPESALEVERHRRNVLRQIRGRDPGAR